MRAKSLSALSALLLLSACAISTPQSTPQMPPMQRPSECLRACPTLPRLTASDEIGVTVWMHELIDLAGQCRRMHDACRGFNGLPAAQ